MTGINSTHIRRGRAFNERLMSGTCRITIITGKTLDRETLKNIDVVEVVYEGICKIRIAAASAGISEREPLGQNLAVQESILSVPVAESTSDIAKNADVEMLTNDDDPTLVGRHWRVKKYSAQTSATARRIVVEDIS